MSTPELRARLEPVLRRTLGAPGTVEALERLTGGAAKRTYRVDARIGTQRQQLILQLASQPSALVARLTPRLSAEQDAALMRAARAGGVDAPRVRAVLAPEDGLGSGFLTDWIEGEALGRRIVHDPAFEAARAALPAQCARNLAAIHRLAPDGLPPLMACPAVQQVDAYAQQVAHLGLRSPALAYALAWARQHAPRDHAMGLVHGDFRMGNLLCAPDGLRLVLDWEVAHLGDPMQDLAWLCLRAWRFGGNRPVAGIGEREAFYRAYQDAGGAALDRGALRFWEAFGNLKWAVMALRKGLAYRDGRPATLEDCAIGRRMEEPLWDFLQVLADEDA